MNEEELVTPWIIGPPPMVSVEVPVGIVTPFVRLPLTIPRFTDPPKTGGAPIPAGAKGRFGSAVLGTVMVNVIFDELI